MRSATTLIRKKNFRNRERDETAESRQVFVIYNPPL